MSHCDAHEVNTTQLASLKSSYGTIKWILTVSIPVMVVITGGTLGVLNSGIDELKSELKTLNTNISNSNVSVGRFEVEITQLRREVEDLKADYHERGNK